MTAGFGGAGSASGCDARAVSGRSSHAKPLSVGSAARDSGAQAEEKGSCCGWSVVDYSLNLDYDGRRISVFVNLPREAKDWLRDRLNAVLAERKAA